MWRPRTESEIQAAIENGIARESASFDAKLALPAAGRNKDLAKDICAMTVDGGFLLFGLGGGDPTRPDQRAPFNLAGAAERIDQVAQAGIAESPIIEIYDIPSEEHPGLGYLGVVVPASPRAPHMLTIDGDNRYWGRGPTGNRILGESEIARLYERRAKWDVDRDHLLDEVVSALPFTFDLEQAGAVVTLVCPLANGRELLRVAAGAQAVDEFLRDQVTAIARQADPYPDQGTSGLGDALRITRTGADLWIMLPTHDIDPGFIYQARAHLRPDGSLIYWHSPIVNQTPGGRVWLMERSVTRAVYQALAAAAFVFQRAGYAGAADVAISVLGIAHATGATLARAFSTAEFGAHEYRRHERVTGEELRGATDGIVRRLLAPMFEVVSVRDYDPLADRR